MITRWGETSPLRVALIAEDACLTHGELTHAARRWAAALTARGVGPGAMVGLHVRRSVHTVIGALAILEAGAAYVPLEPSYPVSRLQFIAQDAAVKLILTESALVDVLGLSLPTLAIDEKPEDLPSNADRPSPHPATPDGVAYVTYTSGSTGPPKGVPMPHRGICESLRWLQRELPYLKDDRALLKSPLGFDVSSRWEMLWPLACGGAIVVAPPKAERDPARLVELIRNESVTIMHFVPSMLEVFLDEPTVAHVSTLRRVFSGGEALTTALKRRFFERLRSCELIDIYGATETIVVTRRRCQADDPPHKHPIGWPISELPICLLDERGRLTEPGQPGEIYVGGTFLARGYLGHPELTEERFTQPTPERARELGLSPAPAVLFKTGDWARRLPSGALEHLGRRDSQVKIRGVRVELGEVEAALEATPEVERAAVITHTSEVGGMRLIAYVRSARQVDDQGALTAELGVHLARTLPPPMCPDVIVALDALPLNLNGKVDRAALSRLSPPDATDFDPPRAPDEVRVAEIYGRLLGRGRVGRHDSLRSLGGDSLTLMRLLIHLRAEMGVKLSPQTLDADLTVTQLAERLGSPERDARTGRGVQELRASAERAFESVIEGLRQDASPNSKSEAPPNAVAMTGATGFLGAFMLAELLTNPEAMVTCLVRGEPEALMERLERSRDMYGLSWSGGRERVRVAHSDLSAPGLGLAPGDRAALIEDVDAVFHLGAHVSEASTLDMLWPTNVSGTGELLRLAAAGGRAALHFVSTTAVFESSGYLDASTIEDTSPLDGAEHVYGGYAQSKWVAEAMLERAHLLNVPVTVYRPGALAGDSRTGQRAEGQVLAKLLRGFMAQRSVPDLSLRLSLTPVDYASRAILHLSRQPWAAGRSFNIVSNESISLAELARIGRELGHPMSVQPPQVWFDDLIKAALRDAEHPLSDVLPLISDTIPGTSRYALEWHDLTARVRCDAEAQLKRAGLRCPSPTASLLSLYLSQPPI